MSIIKDTFFGGAEKKAAKATQKGIEKGIDTTKASVQQARGDINRLFPQAEQNLTQGFQGALDVFRDTTPQQSDIFQQGNINAQQSLLAGLPQIQNALLGGNVDLSGLQPSQQIQPDFGFLSQFINPQPEPEITDPLAGQPQFGINNPFQGVNGTAPTFNPNNNQELMARFNLSNFGGR